MTRVPFFLPALRLLSASCLAAVLISGPAAAQSDSTVVLDGRFPALSEPQFRLMERISFPGELIRDAAWLDAGHYICLTAGPEGARVWSIDYENGDRSMLISPSFFDEYITGFPDCMNLAWKLSPSRRYMFLHWPDSAGEFHWKLLDISDPPFFVSKSFIPPGGMRISDILFSDDDRYAVFSNNAWAEGSEVSLLVLDLLNGSEAWRLSTHDLSFVRRMWWEEDGERLQLNASAELHDGEFRNQPGLAVLDVEQQTVLYDEARSELLMGDSEDWGMVGCYRGSKRPDAAFYLRADVPGHGENMQIPLSDEPLDLACLQEPGLILLRNTINYSISQLWLIDMLNGDKMLVSADCEQFETDGHDRLLVVPRGSNELHVMQLFLPDSEQVQ